MEDQRITFPLQTFDIAWEPGIADHRPVELKELIERVLVPLSNHLYTGEFEFNAVLAKMALKHVDDDTYYSKMIHQTIEFIWKGVPINPRVNSEEQFVFLCMHPRISAHVRDLITYVQRHNTLKLVTS